MWCNDCICIVEEIKTEVVLIAPPSTSFSYTHSTVEVPEFSEPSFIDIIKGDCSIKMQKKNNKSSLLTDSFISQEYRSLKLELEGLKKEEIFLREERQRKKNIQYRELQKCQKVMQELNQDSKERQQEIKELKLFIMSMNKEKESI